MEFLGRQAGKEQGKAYHDNPGRDNSQRGRDNSTRDRDYRDGNRRQNRDTQKMRERLDDTSKE